MLRKLGKGSQGTGSPRPAGPLSIIGSDVRIVGNIITQGEMQIDGAVDGDIACNRLIVGESGRITGEISADTVRIHGHVDGRIIANSVRVARTAEVLGDITHDTLEIEAGGKLEGHLIRKGSQPPIATTTPALAPPRPAEAKTSAPKPEPEEALAEAAQ